MRYSREDKFNPETKMFESSKYSRHLEQVSDEIDKYSEEDRMFILWCLLAEYKDKIEAEIAPDYETATKTQYAANVMIRQHIKAINEMRDFIYMDLGDNSFDDTPKFEWINSDERLPEEYKFVFIYYKNDKDKWIIDIDYISDGEWEHHRYHFPIYWSTEPIKYPAPPIIV